MEYQIIRSARKTLALEITASGGVLVRAPYRISARQIQAFVEKHRSWIEKKLALRNSSVRDVEVLSEEELKALAREACDVIPGRVAYYASLIGVTYGRITIRCQKTRWGSCSAKGNLNFNCLLMLAPVEVLDSVIVHELCHRKEMNHSAHFYAEVLKVFPEYHRWHQWLKEHGAALQARAGSC